MVRSRKDITPAPAGARIERYCRRAIEVAAAQAIGHVPAAMHLLADTATNLPTEATALKRHVGNDKPAQIAPRACAQRPVPPAATIAPLGPA
jgi:hypothetical protein